MIDEIKERKRRAFEFLYLLYQKTVGSNDRWKHIPISELSSELRLYPSVDEDNLTEEEKNELWEAGKKAEQIVSALYEEHFIKVIGRGNPYEGGQVSITKYGIDEVERVLLQGDDRMDEIRNRQTQRFHFLKHLYDKTNEFYATKAKSSSTIFMVDPTEVGEDLGFTPMESRQIAEFLSRDGLVRYVTQKAIKIEHLGIKAVEDALTYEATRADSKDEKNENFMMVTPFFRLPRKPTEQSDIFVLMPFRPELKPVYEDHIKKVAEELALTVTRGDDFFTARSIMEDIWDAICAAKIIIADCTGRNPNVFYELGIAHTVGKPVILITQATDDVPFDLRHIRFIHYEYTPRGMKEFEEKLARTLKALDS
jgi:hypothetical protein